MQSSVFANGHIESPLLTCHPPPPPLRSLRAHSHDVRGHVLPPPPPHTHTVDTL